MREKPTEDVAVNDLNIERDARWRLRGAGFQLVSQLVGMFLIEFEDEEWLDEWLFGFGASWKSVSKAIFESPILKQLGKLILHNSSITGVA